jgi:hypothetical protein
MLEMSHKCFRYNIAMKHTHEWAPEALLKSALFAPLHPILQHLKTNEFPTLHDWNNLLNSYYQELSVQSGYPLRFVSQEQGKLGFESQYEPRCYLSGEVQTRENNWHDLFNALVWLTFPKAKAAINARHYQALLDSASGLESQRGKVRDMATLFDESGVVVVTSRPELTELLCNFKWKELFWTQRLKASALMNFFVFGHGLYEKMLQPYIGLTAQGLVLQVEEAFFGWDLPRQLAFLDEAIAAYLNNAEHCISTRELNPVPLLGVPGWWEDNNKEDFYDNANYFRSGRREQI